MKKLKPKNVGNKLKICLRENKQEDPNEYNGTPKNIINIIKMDPI